jgi:hypothetical protein
MGRVLAVERVGHFPGNVSALTCETGLMRKELFSQFFIRLPSVFASVMPNLLGTAPP